MQVAICDDESEFRQELKASILKYKQNKNIAVDIYEFDNGHSLLNSDQIFDIVFIDYY